MTEADWLAGESVPLMLQYLRGRASDRKLRLFALACVRRVEHWLTDDRTRAALAEAERCAERPHAYRRLINASAAAHAVPENYFDRTPRPMEVCADQAAAYAVSLNAWAAAVRTSSYVREAVRAAPGSFGGPEEEIDQVGLLREIIGDPALRIPARPSWRTPTVKAVARRAYEEQAFAILPILADAMEEGGCPTAELLAHLRRPGGHVRGCWALDLALGKR